MLRLLGSLLHGLRGFAHAILSSVANALKQMVRVLGACNEGGLHRSSEAARAVIDLGNCLPNRLRSGREAFRQVAGHGDDASLVSGLANSGPEQALRPI